MSFQLAAIDRIIFNDPRVAVGALMKFCADNGTMSPLDTRRPLKVLFADKCEEFGKLRKLIMEMPSLDKKFCLNKDNIPKLYEGIITDMSINIVLETNKEII